MNNKQKNLKYADLMLKLKKSLEEISVVANVPLSVVQKIEMQLTSNTEGTLDKLNNFYDHLYLFEVE